MREIRNNTVSKVPWSLICQAWGGGGPRVSGADQARHVRMSIRDISPVIIRTLLETGQSKKVEAWKMKIQNNNRGCPESTDLRWNGRQHVSSVHIRHFAMIQHVQVQLPCLQSRTKTTCKYQNYTFSSITWYVNKPTNVQCLCSMLWVNKRNEVEENLFSLLYFVGLWNSFENHLSQDKSVTIWRYDISKLSQEFWRNGNVESR